MPNLSNQNCRIKIVAYGNTVGFLVGEAVDLAPFDDLRPFPLLFFPRLDDLEVEVDSVVVVSVVVSLSLFFRLSLSFLFRAFVRFFAPVSMASSRRRIRC